MIMEKAKGKGHAAELGFKIGIDSGWREKRKSNGWKMKIVVGWEIDTSKEKIHPFIHS